MITSSQPAVIEDLYPAAARVGPGGGLRGRRRPPRPARQRRVPARAPHRDAGAGRRQPALRPLRRRGRGAPPRLRDRPRHLAVAARADDPAAVRGVRAARPGPVVDLHGECDPQAGGAAARAPRALRSCATRSPRRSTTRRWRSSTGSRTAAGRTRPARLASCRPIAASPRSKTDGRDDRGDRPRSGAGRRPQPSSRRRPRYTAMTLDNHRLAAQASAPADPRCPTSRARNPDRRRRRAQADRARPPRRRPATAGRASRSTSRSPTETKRRRRQAHRRGDAPAREARSTQALAGAALADPRRPSHPPLADERPRRRAARPPRCAARCRRRCSAPASSATRRRSRRAVYFCCLEAMQNAAKHAHGASARRDRPVPTPARCGWRCATTAPATTPGTSSTGSG